MEVNLREKDSYEEGSQRSEKCVIACDGSTKDDPQNRTSKEALVTTGTGDSQGIKESKPSGFEFVDLSSKKIFGLESKQGGSYLDLWKNNKAKEKVKERDELQREEKRRTEEDINEQEKEEQKNASNQMEGEREKQEEVEKEEMQEEVEKWEQQEQQEEKDNGKEHQNRGRRENQEMPAVGQRGATKQKEMGSEIYEEEERKMEQETNEIIVAGEGEKEKNEVETQQKEGKNKTEGREEQQEAPSVAEREDEDCKGKVKEEQEQKVSRQEEEEKQEEKELEEQEEGRGHEKQKEDVEQGQLPRLKIERDGERARQETRDPKAQTAACRVAGVQPSVSQAAADVQWAKVGVKVIQGKDNSPCQQGGPSLSRWVWERGNIAFPLVPLLLFGPLAWAGLADLHVEGKGRTLQGENYSLVCLVTPAPASNTTVYTWIWNNEIMQHQNKQVLSLSPLRKTVEGDYSCSVDQGSTEKFQLSEPFHLHVTVFENISLVPEVEVEEGQTVILTCSVHSDPTAFLTWYLDKEVVRTTRSNSDSLVLHNASRLHLKVVQCQAYNEALVLGFLNAYTLIRMKGTYEAIPKPYLRPRGVPVLHRPFDMECLLMDVPNSGVNVHLTYTWYKDNVLIEGQSDRILHFPSVIREDTGRYTCTARNGKPLTTSLQSNIFSMQVLLPPEVHIEPKTEDQIIRCTPGENLTLTCEVTKDHPEVVADGYRWSYLPLHSGELTPLEGIKSTLPLGPLTKQDSGQYFCQTWNYKDFGGLLPPGNASVTVDVSPKNISSTNDLQVNKVEPGTLTKNEDISHVTKSSIESAVLPDTESISTLGIVLPIVTVLIVVLVTVVGCLYWKKQRRHNGGAYKLQDCEEQNPMT